MKKKTYKGTMLADVSRSISTDGSGDFSGVFAPPTLAGPTVNEASALGIPSFYAAVSCYVNTIGTLGFYLARHEERGGRKPALDHPVNYLISKEPNRYSTSVRFRQDIVGHAITTGNGYAEIIRGPRRVPVELQLMNPFHTKPEILDDGRLVYRDTRNGKELDQSDVIHIALFGFDGIQGYSPVKLFRETLGIPMAQRTYQAALYGNGASMSGHFESDRYTTSKQRSEFRDTVNVVHQGPHNAGKIGIVEGGYRWVQTSFSPADAEFILSCGWYVKDVARMFGLPAHKIGDLEHSTLNNLEQLNRDFYQTSILPRLVTIEAEFDRKLLTRVEQETYFVTFDPSSLLRGDSAAQSAQEERDIANGIRSINEVRLDRGLNPLDAPQADYHFIPTNNLQPIETMKLPADPATTSPPGEIAQDDQV